VFPDFFQGAAYDNCVPKKGGEYHAKDVLDLFVGGEYHAKDVLDLFVCFWAYFQLDPGLRSGFLCDIN
jgi:hypothetical protein